MQFAHKCALWWLFYSFALDVCCELFYEEDVHVDNVRAPAKSLFASVSITADRHYIKLYLPENFTTLPYFCEGEVTARMMTSAENRGQIDLVTTNAVDCSTFETRTSTLTCPYSLTFNP